MKKGVQNNYITHAMAPLPKIIDTHIHLWPSTATAPTDHGWMTQGHPLAKRHGVADYDNATSASPVRPSGFVYVETDRCLPSAVPEMQEDAQDDEEKERRLRAWAKAPLEELDFLKRIVGGEPRDGDGFSSEHDGRRLVGLVVWAPFHLPPELFSLYMRIVESVLQPSAWERVVGFRYLLQGKGVDEVRNVVESEHWLSNLVSIGQGRAGKGWSFDVGVDCHRDGVEGLEVVARMVERVRAVEQLQGRGNKVRFVLSKCSFFFSFLSFFGRSWGSRTSATIRDELRLCALAILLAASPQRGSDPACVHQSAAYASQHRWVKFSSAS